MSCHFRHDNIVALHGIKPVPISDLPKVCTCGATLTYANEVIFISFPESRTTLYDESGNVIVTLEPRGS